MNGNDVIALGWEIETPGKIVGRLRDTDPMPHELRLVLKAGRGSAFPCPDWGRPCKVHDFKEMTWRHLNCFPHRCSSTAPVPRVRCPRHGVKRIQVLWARQGSKPPSSRPRRPAGPRSRARSKRLRRNSLRRWPGSSPGYLQIATAWRIKDVSAPGP